MTEIDKNCACLEGSFLGGLWREYFFDTNALKNLIDEIIELIKISRDMTNELCRLRFIIKWQKKIFFIHWRIYVNISSHFDPSDLFKIKHFDHDKLYEYLDRLQFVIECFLENDYNRIADYEDNLGKLV